MSAARFEQTFRDHEGQLIQFLTLRLGSRAEAQDAAQMTFLRLWQRREELNGSNLVGLVYTTARNIATDLLRSRTYRASSGASALDDHAEDSPSIDRVVAAKQRLDLLRALLDELPPKCRTAFIQYKLEEREYFEVACRMGITESMVRKYVLRAVAYCASRMQEMEANRG